MALPRTCCPLQLCDLKSQIYSLPKHFLTWCSWRHPLPKRFQIKKRLFSHEAENLLQNSLSRWLLQDNWVLSSGLDQWWGSSLGFVGEPEELSVHCCRGSLVSLLHMLSLLCCPLCFSLPASSKDCLPNSLPPAVAVRKGSQRSELPRGTQGHTRTLVPWLSPIQGISREGSYLWPRFWN